MAAIKMKTVTEEELSRAYQSLFPEEVKTDSDLEETKRILGNWLHEYTECPAKKLATTNWCGKVTKALFLAFGIKTPRTKKEMLAILQVKTDDVQVIKPAPALITSEDTTVVVVFTRTVTLDVPVGSDKETIKVLATEQYNALDPEDRNMGLQHATILEYLNR